MGRTDFSALAYSGTWKQTGTLRCNYCLEASIGTSYELLPLQAICKRFYRTKEGITANQGVTRFGYVAWMHC